MLPTPTLDTFLGSLGVSDDQWADIQEESRAARWGAKLIRAAEIMTPLVTIGARPLALLIAVSAASVAPAFGQGPIIGPNPGNFGTTIVKMVQLLYQIIFVIGIVGAGVGVAKMVTSGGEVPWKLFIGAGLCFGVSIVASLIYNLSKGTTVDIDTSGLGGN